MLSRFRNIVLTDSQRGIFEKVKAFVMENRDVSAASTAAKLSLPNIFSSRDRTFITKLSDDLHLNVSWDEYDDQDQNLVTWRLPGALADDGEAEVDQEVEDDQEGEDEGEWEDTEDDEEAKAAVDRVLKKYEKANVLDAEGSFDERHERLAKEKMEEWKREYYRVSDVLLLLEMNRLIVALFKGQIGNFI